MRSEDAVIELASQWPILALVLAILLGAGRVIQQQYEARIRELREDVVLWREIALSGTKIADTMTSVVEHAAKRRQP